MNLKGAGKMNEANERDTRRDFFKAAGTVAGATVLASLLGSGSAAAQEIELNAMQPTPEQLQAFMALPSGPVCMVNLIKLKKDTGEQYAKYGVEVGKILTKIGAEMVFSGQCKGALIGGATWDAVAIVRYPDKTALLKMAQSEEYQAIHHYREDGLEGQINLAVFEQGFEAAAGGDGDGVTADQIMSQMDANKDGKIVKDEAPEQLKAAFGMVDANGDGAIDLTEAQTIADFMNNQ